ncbi:hypothetical protein JYT28_00470 [Desulfobulbus sp. AH-315-M07]|nr:hypothetical protein [Desulfobulbus sp. AH-315-M07]
MAQTARAQEPSQPRVAVAVTGPDAERNVAVAVHLKDALRAQGATLVPNEQVTKAMRATAGAKPGAKRGSRLWQLQERLGTSRTIIVQLTPKDGPLELYMLALDAPGVAHEHEVTVRADKANAAVSAWLGSLPSLPARAASPPSDETKKRKKKRKRRKKRKKKKKRDRSGSAHGPAPAAEHPSGETRVGTPYVALEPSDEWRVRGAGPFGVLIAGGAVFLVGAIGGPALFASAASVREEIDRIRESGECEPNCYFFAGEPTDPEIVSLNDEQKSRDAAAIGLMIASGTAGLTLLITGWVLVARRTGPSDEEGSRFARVQPLLQVGPAGANAGVRVRW